MKTLLLVFLLAQATNQLPPKDTQIVPSGGGSGALHWDEIIIDSSPMDVPAISYRDKVATCHDSCAGSADMCAGVVICEKAEHWTCKDKSRVLLASEDGQKHCVRFSGYVTGGGAIQ